MAGFRPSWTPCCSGLARAYRAVGATRTATLRLLHGVRRRVEHSLGGRGAATTDDATPNPNAIAAQNLIRLAALTGDIAWREQADRLFDGVLAGAAESLLQHAELLNALDLRLHAAEVVVTGPEHERFAAAALKLPYLSRIVLRAPDAQALPTGHPAQAKIAAAGAGSAAFVCVGETCSLPVTDPDKIADAVNAMQPATA